MNKQNMQVLILGGLMLVMIVVAVLSFSGGPSPTLRPKPDKKTAQNKKAESTTVASIPGGLVWVNDARLSTVIEDVKQGRDPFRNTLLSKLPPPAAPPVPTTPAPGSHTNPLPPSPGNDNAHPLPPLTKTLDVPITLQWVTVRDVRKQIEKEKVLVDITAPDEHGQRLVLHGSTAEINDAMKVIRTIEQPLPTPKFSLMGVITGGSRRYAIIHVDGADYRLFEGDTIPRLGWTVTAITAAGVKLTKGQQQVLLGGLRP